MSEHTPKVLILRSSAGFYGAERVIVTLVRSLIREEANVIVAPFENDLDAQHLFISHLSNAKIPTAIIPGRKPFSLKAVRHIIKLCHEHDIDVIHTHDYKSTVHGLAAAKKLGIGICATSHGAILNGFKLKLYHFVEIEAYKFFDRVAVVSTDLMTTLSAKAIPRDKLSIIRNAIDTDKFSPMDPAEVHAFRKELGIPVKDWVFCNVGRLSPEKGHADLITAFDQFLQHHQNATLLIVGDGELEFEITKQIRERGLINNVKCFGARPDIEKIYGISDCYVSSSHTEGMPMVVLEAMACGLPVIATDVGEVGNIIESALCGYLTEAKNIAGLAELMQKIHSTKNLESLTERAREYAITNFSTETQAASYLNLYQSIQKKRTAMSKRAIPVLMYHGIQSSAEDEGMFDPVYSVSEQDFIHQLDLIIKLGYQSQLLVDALKKPADKAVVITFDDGDLTNYTKALPLLQERGMVAEFFITTDRIDTTGSMTRAQLQEMERAGMSIQGHGHTHRYLSDLSEQDVEYELATCKQTLDEICTQPIVTTALPGGRGNAVVTNISKRTGYEFLCTSEVGHNNENVDHFAVKRIPILASTSLEQLQQYLAGTGSAWRKIMLKQQILGIVKKVLGNKNYDNLRSRFV